MVIRTKHGYEVSGSAEHRWMTARGLVSTGDLEIGDRIAVASIPSFPGTEEIDPEFAWFIGFLVGDGNYTNRSEGQLHLACTTPELGERYRAFLAKRGLHSAWRRDNRGIHSTSKPFRAELERLGVSYVKGPLKVIPQAIWESGPLAWGGFLQGLFDADGSVSVRSPIRLSTSSIQLSIDVQLMLLALGISSARYSYRVWGRPKLYWHVAIGAAGIDRFKTLIGFSHPEKRAKLNARRHNRVITHDDGYDPVVEIQKTGRTINMVDIEIPSPHLISFSSLMGHNSQGSEFEIVIVPMHFSSYIMLKRRLFYTAVARARRTVVVVGQAKAVRTAISRHDPLARRTLLGALIAAGPGAEIPLAPLAEFEDDLF